MCIENYNSELIPQISEVFKIKLRTKLYWVLFPIDDLEEAVETAKGILTEEKIDRQLAGHSSSTPFSTCINRSYTKFIYTMMISAPHLSTS